MRKMKKLNGYLVVRFNDREKREYEGTGLGNFGVIDAELYTGILDVDRSVMEYDDIETLEIALEQARGLESELDVVEPEVKITVIIEGETEVSEEDVEPESLFKGHRATLEAQLRHGPHLDLDPLTAAHELHGYARALEDLGMIDGHDERFLVERDTFGATAPPPDQQEEALAYICDEVCKYREGRTQEELDGICAKCKVDRWAGAPPTLTPQEVRELRHLRRLLKEVSDYVNDGGPATPGSSARRLEVKLPERITPETLQKIMNAAQSGESPRETFENAPSGIRNDYNTKKVYALGLALVEECPENDCKVYLTNGNHQLRVEAVDGNFATSVRVWTFSKKESVICFQLNEPEETDEAASKVLVTPTWHIEGAAALVEACNNAFDAEPTWEDITPMVAINRVYNFTNKTKTADKWGVNIRFTITKNEGYEGEVSISGFGGAYE